MGQALYRKYRSKSLDEVVGQEHITKTLDEALKSGRISHAYLLSGPRGVGKTSVARILAHRVNDLDYVAETVHLDIIEIDAASNRGIDEIRELRQRVHITPSSAKYKIYIIDEVHMLTREAFNALLKTLEEPPDHSIFILATTEPHKLPETIVSRTQRFNFKLVGSDVVAAHLAHIAKKEKLQTTPEALQMMADHGGGSLRDSISLLDQLRSSGQEITAQAIERLVGLVPAKAVDGLLESLSRGHGGHILKKIDKLRESGINPVSIANQLAAKLRQEIIAGQSQPWMIDLLRSLLNVATSLQPFDDLEISLLEAASDNQTPSRPKASSAEPKGSAPKSQPATIKNTSLQKPASKRADFDLKMWPQIIEQIKVEAAFLYTALRLAIPKLAGQTLILSFQFPLHQKKVNQLKHLDLIGRIIEQTSGQKIKVRCQVDKSAFSSPRGVEKKSSPAKKRSGGSLQTISNIFGTAEVLES